MPLETGATYAKEGADSMTFGRLWITWSVI
jgi:hypothetical protein